MEQRQISKELIQGLHDMQAILLNITETKLPELLDLFNEYEYDLSEINIDLTDAYEEIYKVMDDFRNFRYNLQETVTNSYE